MPVASVAVVVKTILPRAIAAVAANAKDRIAGAPPIRRRGPMTVASAAVVVETVLPRAIAAVAAGSKDRVAPGASTVGKGYATVIACCACTVAAAAGTRYAIAAVIARSAVRFLWCTVAVSAGTR